MPYIFQRVTVYCPLFLEFTCKSGHIRGDIPKNRSLNAAIFWNASMDIMAQYHFLDTAITFFKTPNNTPAHGQIIHVLAHAPVRKLINRYMADTALQ